MLGLGVLLWVMDEGMGNPLERKELVLTRVQEMVAGWPAVGGGLFLWTELSLLEKRLL